VVEVKVMSEDGLDMFDLQLCGEDLESGGRLKGIAVRGCSGVSDSGHRQLGGGDGSVVQARRCGPHLDSGTTMINSVNSVRSHLGSTDRVSELGPL